MTEKQKSLSEVVDLIRKQKIAMFTTHEGETLVSRPMGMQEPDDDGTLWFFCKADSDVARQVEADSRVNVALSDGDYLSVFGRAALVDDVAKKKELWGPFVETWMQTEPEDPQARLIRVAPETIGYWDTPNAVGSMMAMVGGLIGDKEPDVGETGVVNA